MKKKHKKTLAGTVRYREYKLMLFTTGLGFAVMLFLLVHALWKEGISIVGIPSVLIMLAFLLLFLVIFWKYLRFSILYSERHRTFIVNTMLTHRVYSVSDISSIQPQEIRSTSLPSLRGGLEVHDEQESFLLIRCGRHKIHVNRYSEGADQFILFLQKTTPPEIWQEVSRIRWWDPLDLLFYSDDDPWEIARKEQKRKNKVK